MSHDNVRDSNTAVASVPNVQKVLVIVSLVLAAFLLSYSYASAKSGTPGGAATSPLAALGGDASAGDGCCGGGGAPVEGAATVEGGVQKIEVDTSAGSFNPNVIKAKAGVPIEITFSQAPGGCLSGVLFGDFDINEDLTGGAKTIKLPALEAGQYQFSCQMQMVTGTLVIE